MKKENFATKLGFENWRKLSEVSTELFLESGDISWYITELPDGRWAAWDDAEVSINRVQYFYDRHEAEDFQVVGFAQKIENRAEQFMFVLRALADQLDRPHREGHCEHAGRCEVIPVLAGFLESPEGAKSLDSFGNWYSSQTPHDLFTELASGDFRSTDWIHEDELPAWYEAVKVAKIEHVVMGMAE